MTTERIDVREAIGRAAAVIALHVSYEASQDLRKANAAVAELIEAAANVADTTPEHLRADWACHKGITTATKCGRCSRELRLAAALARVGAA